MRKTLFSLIIFTILLGSCSKEPAIHTCNFINYKYYHAAKEYLGELSNDYIVIGCDTSYDSTEIQHLIYSKSYFDKNYKYTIYNFPNHKFKEIPLKFTNPKSCEDITDIIADLHKSSIVSYAHYTMKAKGCSDLLGRPMGNKCVQVYGSFFYVKVYDDTNLSDLIRMADSTNTQLMEALPYTTKWYKLVATKNSKGDALAMANYFFESRLFEASEPGIGIYPVE